MLSTVCWRNSNKYGSIEAILQSRTNGKQLGYFYQALDERLLGVLQHFCVVRYRIDWYIRCPNVARASILTSSRGVLLVVGINKPLPWSVFLAGSPPQNLEFQQSYSFISLVAASVDPDRALVYFPKSPSIPKGMCYVLEFAKPRCSKPPAAVIREPINMCSASRLKESYKTHKAMFY